MSENILFLKAVEKDLKKAGALSPGAEAEMLLSHYGKLDRLELFTGRKKFTGNTKLSVKKAVQKRRRGVPLAYITGRASFYGRSFAVTQDTLIPRPETERLVEEALKVLNGPLNGKKASILDLGTGSGCIAASLTLEGPDCRMTAIDVSAKALAVARKNFKRLGLSKKIASYSSGLFSRFFDRKALWDIIVSNPPYIPKRDLGTLSREVRKEPKLALNGGPDGLFVVDRILGLAPRYLKSGGWLLMEIGKGQSKKLAKKWSRDERYASFSFEKDLNGIERILIARVHG